MPYWNFEYTKVVIYTVVKVGGGTGQGPATEVTLTHLRLNQPPVFPANSLQKKYEINRIRNLEYENTLQ